MNDLYNLRKEFERISRIEKYESTEYKLYLCVINDKWFLSDNNMKKKYKYSRFSERKTF
jgi:hypothetical protein